MTIISNASPLINFSCLNRLDIIKSLYGNIIIPQEVYFEITKKGNNHYGATKFSKYDWINVIKVKDKKIVSTLEIELDTGESEVLALAIETDNPLVLMDEKIGRLIAKRLNISVIGTIGILVEAKHKGIIKNIKELIDALIIKNGFRISKRLYQKVIDQKY